MRCASRLDSNLAKKNNNAINGPAFQALEAKYRSLEPSLILKASARVTAKWPRAIACIATLRIRLRPVSRGGLFCSLLEGGEPGLLPGAEFLTAKEEDDEKAGHRFLGEDARATGDGLEGVAVDGFGAAGDAAPGQLFFRLDDSQGGLDAGGAVLPGEGGVRRDGGFESDGCDTGHPGGPVWHVDYDLPDAGDRRMDEYLGVGLDGRGGIDAAPFGVVAMQGLKRGAGVEERLKHQRTLRCASRFGKYLIA